MQCNFVSAPEGTTCHYCKKELHGNTIGCDLPKWRFYSKGKFFNFEPTEHIFFHESCNKGEFKKTWHLESPQIRQYPILEKLQGRVGYVLELHHRSLSVLASLPFLGYSLYHLDYLSASTYAGLASTAYSLFSDKGFKTQSFLNLGFPLFTFLIDHSFEQYSLFDLNIAWLGSYIPYSIVDLTIQIISKNLLEEPIETWQVAAFAEVGVYAAKALAFPLSDELFDTGFVLGLGSHLIHRIYEENEAMKKAKNVAILGFGSLILLSSLETAMHLPENPALLLGFVSGAASGALVNKMTYIASRIFF